MVYNLKKAPKHLFKGTATIYWWDGYNWRIQTKHSQTIGLLHNTLYNKVYKPMSKNEQLVFTVKDSDFNKIYKLMKTSYKIEGEYYE